MDYNGFLLDISTFIERVDGYSLLKTNTISFL